MSARGFNLQLGEIMAYLNLKIRLSILLLAITNAVAFITGLTAVSGFLVNLNDDQKAPMFAVLGSVLWGCAQLFTWVAPSIIRGQPTDWMAKLTNIHAISAGVVGAWFWLSASGVSQIFIILGSFALAVVALGCVYVLIAYIYTDFTVRLFQMWKNRGAKKSNKK